jgi:hypothetical protein
MLASASPVEKAGGASHARITLGSCTVSVTTARRSAVTAGVETGVTSTLGPAGMGAKYFSISALMVAGS